MHSLCCMWPCLSMATFAVSISPGGQRLAWLWISLVSTNSFGWSVMMMIFFFFSVSLGLGHLSCCFDRSFWSDLVSPCEFFNLMRGKDFWVWTLDGFPRFFAILWVYLPFFTKLLSMTDLISWASLIIFATSVTKTLNRQVKNSKFIPSEFHLSLS
jgi:hypothetical protein